MCKHLHVVPPPFPVVAECSKKSAPFRCPQIKLSADMSFSELSLVPERSLSPSSLAYHTKNIFGSCQKCFGSHQKKNLNHVRHNAKLSQNSMGTHSNFAIILTSVDEFCRLKFFVQCTSVKKSQRQEQWKKKLQMQMLSKQSQNSLGFGLDKKVWNLAADCLCSKVT